MSHQDDKDEPILDDIEAAEAEMFGDTADLEDEDEPQEEAPSDDGAPQDDRDAQIAALADERDALQDRLLRALADTENLRKRAERDRRDAEIYGGTKLARDLLSVFDNLGRALESADDSIRETAPALIEGIELTQRELLSNFGKHKIEMINPEAGEKFDPKLHQAMFEAPVPGHEPNTIIQVMTVGFMIGDRLLRPAQVGVASAAN